MPTMVGMEGLSEVLATADHLYGLLPEAFTAARDERVRTLRREGSLARAVAVKDLRRPSVAAWLVNALVRHRAEEVDQLLLVGRSLREAHDTLDPDQLRELDRQRQAVLSAMCRQARDLAGELGRPVSDPVLAEVEETLRAALADPGAASAVRSGRLTAALKYAGLGDRDVAPAPGAGRGRTQVAVPAGWALRRTATATATTTTGAAGPDGDAASSPPGPDAAARRVALREATLAVTAAGDASQTAEGAALAAEQHRDTLLRRARIAQERLAAAHAQVAELESRLTNARAAASTAAAAWAPLHAEADAATARADAARGLAHSARAMLASARAHLADVESGRLVHEPPP